MQSTKRGPFEEQSGHIPVRVLWEFTKGMKQLNEVERLHLAGCETCVGVLGICRSAQSLKHAESLVEEETEANQRDSPHGYAA